MRIRHLTIFKIAQAGAGIEASNLKEGFLGGLMLKNPLANVGDADSVSTSGRSPGEGNGTPLQSLTWKIPWVEEPGRPQSMGSQRVGHN